MVAQAGEVSVDRRAELASELGAVPAGRRHALLATCHRVELYGVGEPVCRPDMRLLRGEAAVRRLFRVAAGLEPDMAAGARWARTSHSVEPDPGWAGPVAERYHRFRELAG